PGGLIAGIDWIDAQSAPITIDLMAMQACICNDTADVAHRFLISGLRSFIGGLARLSEFDAVLDPLRIIDRHRPAVLAASARSEHQRCRFGEGNGRIVD